MWMKPGKPEPWVVKHLKGGKVGRRPLVCILRQFSGGQIIAPTTTITVKTATEIAEWHNSDLIQMEL